MSFFASPNTFLSFSLVLFRQWFTQCVLLLKERERERGWSVRLMRVAIKCFFPKKGGKSENERDGGKWENKKASRIHTLSFKTLFLGKWMMKQEWRWLSHHFSSSLIFDFQSSGQIFLCNNFLSILPFNSFFFFSSSSSNSQSFFFVTFFVKKLFNLLSQQKKVYYLFLSSSSYFEPNN